MAKEINYTLLVNGQFKRMNTDLKRLQMIAEEYMQSDDTIAIRCPQFGGSGAQAGLLTYNRATKAWDKTKS